MDVAPRRTRTRLVIAGAGLIVAASLLGLWVLLRGNNPFAVDAAWNDWVVTWDVGPLTAFGYAMAWIGGGWFGIFASPLAVAAALFFVRRPWAAAYFLVAEAFSAALVQVLKHLFGRARPEEILIVTDYGSFPSGHTANAATLAVAFFILFPRVWVAIAGSAWVVLMAFSRTILHAHWLSDTLGGALIGAGAALLVAAAFTVPLVREAAQRQARVTDAAEPPPSLG